MAEESIWSSLPTILTAIGGVLTAAATLVGALYSAGLIGRARRSSERRKSADAETTPATPPVLCARCIPGILSVDQVKATLVRRGIYDARWNAGAVPGPASYQAQVVGDALVVADRVRGLLWERSGSPRPLSFEDAEAYVLRLRSRVFAGCADWRLPTLEEAGALLAPEARGGLHLNPTFEKSAPFIWTADRRPDDRIWMVYFVEGVVDSERPGFHAWVRAVRSSAS